ncbi:MAG: hypothetical protein AAB935_00110 [Patescibacteria group bacterium]
MSKQETPEFKPISEEERDALEGVTPVEKETMKRGLQTPWNETLNALELKAQDILPEESVKDKEPSKQAQSESILRKLLEEYKETATENVNLVEQLNSTWPEDKDYFPAKLMKTIGDLYFVINLMLERYKLSVNENARAIVLERMIETTKTRNFLIQEALKEAKLNKERGTKENEK